MLSKFKISLALVLILLCYFLNQHLLSQIERPKVKVDKNDQMFNLQDHYLQIFHFGQKRFFSSALWVHTLLASDESHYKGESFHNWMFLRFKSISLLDPRFYENYRYGGLYLSVIKDDDEGAKYIYDKGLNFFPNDYHLNYFAAFHYYLELSDYSGAIKIYKNLLLNIPESTKRFPLLEKIVARLEASEGNIETAYQLLLNAHNSLPKEEAFTSRYKDSLYALKAEIDLNCLNQAKPGCDVLDFQGKPYIKDRNGQYQATQSWQKFRRIR
jgi:hypothetical protein